MSVVRWSFEEVATGDTYVAEINPNEAGSHRKTKELDFAQGAGTDERWRTVMDQEGPVDWTFGGVIRTKAHFDALLEWSRKPGKVRVTDHLGRTFEVMMSKLDVKDRRPTGATPWRLRYTMSALLLRRIA